MLFTIYRCIVAHGMHVFVRGIHSNGMAVKIFSGHPSILKLCIYMYVQIFRPVLFLVWAAEGKTGFLLGAFIIGLTLTELNSVRVGISQFILNN